MKETKSRHQETLEISRLINSIENQTERLVDMGTDVQFPSLVCNARQILALIHMLKVQNPGLPIEPSANGRIGHHLDPDEAIS